MPAKKVIVVGAGVSGLALAYRLQVRAPSVEITVLEQDARPGGTAWTLRQDGFQLEVGPNGFLDNKPSTLGLAREVGLEAELRQASAVAAKNRFLWMGNELERLPASPSEFLRSGLLSARGKLGLLLERWRYPKQLDKDESIAAFARRRAGNEAAEVFGDALVTGIYAGDPELLSLPACFPRLATMEKQHGSVMKGLAAAARQRRTEAKSGTATAPRSSTMWSFQGGMRLFVEKLASRLSRPPVCGIGVRRIARDGAPARLTWIVHGDGRDQWEADALVLTCPAHQQAGLLAELDSALAHEIAAIPYNRITVVGLGYRQADVPTGVSGFGFIAPQRTRRAVLGVQWCSSIFPDRAPPGAILLRAMCGGWHRADMVGWSDERLLAAVRGELRQSMGITAAPIFQKIIRWDRAIPQYHVGHLDRLRAIDDHLVRHPGLFLGGNAYRGVALNDCTEQGQVLAGRICSTLGVL